MLIDWFTVVAQVVNFLVLVALLKRFLWGRLTQAIDAREARVAGELARAEQKNKDAQRLAEELRARALEQEQKRDEMLAQARKQADAQHAKLVQEARETVREVERKWHDALEQEQNAFFSEMRLRAAEEVLTVIRRGLADLASSDLREAAIAVFLEKLRSIDVSVLQDLGTKEKLVRSAGEIPEVTRQKVGAVLAERLGAPQKLRFEEVPGMAWGIELRGNGRKIGWNPECYLDEMQENLRKALERRAEVVDREAVR